MAESNDIYKTLDLSLRVGELLLASGAGASDVASQMYNVASACGLRGFTADVTFTELAMSHQARSDEPALIQLRQVRHREIDYGDLTAVDHLVRDLVAGRITRNEARTRLNRITSSGHSLPRWAVTVGYGGMGVGVAMLLGAGPMVLLIAFLAAVGIDLLQRRMSRARLPFFYQQVAGGLLVTLFAVGTSALDIGVEPSRVVTASIILLLSGVNFLGAIQDALTGYPLTAGARVMEALLATAGVIAGVSGGLSSARLLGVDLGRLDPGAQALSDLPLMVLGAALAAASYAFASYAPYRSLAPIAVVSALATAIYALMTREGFGIAWSSGVAAVVVGLVAYSVAGRWRVPALIVVVCAVVPLLPGLSIYRGLTLLSQDGDAGLVTMVTAGAIAIALSAGVILGEYVAQPLKREARRLEDRLSGPRLVGPMHGPMHGLRPHLPHVPRVQSPDPPLPPQPRHRPHAGWPRRPG